MKKIISIILAGSLSLSAHDYDINQLLSIAVADGNGDLFTQLALTMPETDRDKKYFKTKMKAVGLTEATFKSNLDAAQKRLDYTSAAGCISAKEAEALLEKYKVPPLKINSKADAQKELVNFFEKGTGKDLLTAIDATPNDINAVKTALVNINVK